MTIPTKPKRLLNASELAAWLSWSIGTVYNKVSRGEIPCCRPGQSLRFDPDEIRDWMKKKSSTKRRTKV